MIIRIDTIKTIPFIYPEKDEYVFLQPEGLEKDGVPFISVFNLFNQRIGFIPRIWRFKDKIIQTFLQNKPVTAKTVLVNKQHDFIMIEIDFELHVKLAHYTPVRCN